MRPLVPLAHDRAVRVFEYRCEAHRGARGLAEQHRRPSIALVLSGAFCYRSEGQVTALGPGSLLLGNPCQEYCCTHEFGDGDRCLVFEYEPGALSEVAGEAEATKVFRQSVLAPSPRIEGLARLATGGGGASVEELGLEIARATLQLLGTAPSPPPISKGPDRDRAVAAAAFLDRRCADEVGLAAAANEVGLSPFHFLRLFKRELGVTPHQYLIRARMRRAIALLRDTRRPVTAIALDCGFADLSNFVNTFRRVVGRSPRAYRMA
ncbi:MAG: helix-turn-helix transcriptional regulator [Myxococcaceae bacterium]